MYHLIKSVQSSHFQSIQSVVHGVPFSFYRGLNGFDTKQSTPKLWHLSLVKESGLTVNATRNSLLGREGNLSLTLLLSSRSSKPRRKLLIMNSFNLWTVSKIFIAR
eukprot:c5213_g1_i1 orf=300-617(+)